MVQDPCHNVVGCGEGRGYDATNDVEWASTNGSDDSIMAALAPTDRSVNVFGEPLETCSERPRTGFFRDGCCNTGERDVGSHTVCVEVTRAFLEFSRFRGNDLSTPMPQLDFPGLRPGDRWCLCAARWLEAHEHGVAPRVLLKSTHERALEIVPLKLLKQFAADLS